MLPRISIGDISLPFFSIGFSVASVVFLILSVRSLRKKDIDFDSASSIVLLILFSVIFFSKVPLALFHGLKPRDMFKFWETGHTLFGGLIISTVIIYIYSRFRRLDFIKVLAGLSYPAMFALSAYRLFVCLPVGCCYGFPYHHGILLSEESFAGREFGHAIRLFPSQIVEAFLFSVFGLILYEIERIKEGKLVSAEVMREHDENMILYFLFLLVIERFIAELIRYDIKEKVIKIDGHGLSVWFLFSLFIFSVVSFYFKLFRKYIDEIKKAFSSILLLVSIASFAVAQSLSCSGRDKENFEYVPEAMKLLHSFSYSVIFVSYVFIKVRGFIGLCTIVSEGKANISCSFDMRIASASNLNAQGSCDIEGSKFTNCNLRLRGERFYSEIYGRVEFFREHKLYLESITINILRSNFYVGSITIEDTDSEIILIEGGSIRNFKIRGRSQIRDSKIEVNGDILVRDAGVGFLEISPRASVRIGGCIEVNSDITSNDFIVFSDDGCAWQGRVEFGGTQFSIVNGAVTSDSKSYACQKGSSCVAVYF